MWRDPRYQPCPAPSGRALSVQAIHEIEAAVKRYGAGSLKAAKARKKHGVRQRPYETKPSETSTRVLHALEKKSPMSARDAATILGITPRSADAALRRLHRNGLVVRSIRQAKFKESRVVYTLREDER